VRRFSEILETIGDEFADQLKDVLDIMLKAKSKTLIILI